MAITPKDELGAGEYWEIRHVVGDSIANIYLKDGWEVTKWKLVSSKDKFSPATTRSVIYLLRRKAKKY